VTSEDLKPGTKKKFPKKSNYSGSLIDANCSMLPKAWFGFCIWYSPITNRLHSCNIIVNFHDTLWTLQRQKDDNIKKCKKQEKTRQPKHIMKLQNTKT
jgi:hypothetical protein